MVIIEKTYKMIMEEEHELIEEGKISLPIPTSMENSNQRIYEWKMQQYKLGSKNFFSIQFIPKAKL